MNPDGGEERWFFSSSLWPFFTGEGSRVYSCNCMGSLPQRGLLCGSYCMNAVFFLPSFLPCGTLYNKYTLPGLVFFLLRCSYPLARPFFEASLHCRRNLTWVFATARASNDKKPEESIYVELEDHTMDLS